jgi:hypothetical protein
VLEKGFRVGEYSKKFKKQVLNLCPKELRVKIVG